MKASELRLGNMIMLGEAIALVSHLESWNTGGSINEVNQDMVDPIPLTLDRLFMLHGDYTYEPKTDDIIIYVVDKNNAGVKRTSMARLRRPEHAHTFQNRYHALTGKELELKEPEAFSGEDVVPAEMSGKDAMVKLGYYRKMRPQLANEDEQKWMDRQINILHRAMNGIEAPMEVVQDDPVRDKMSRAERRAADRKQIDQNGTQSK